MSWHRKEAVKHMGEKSLSRAMGESFEDAIKVYGVKTRAEVTAFEYDWIVSRFGEMHFSWRLVGHDMLYDDRRFCDRVVIQPLDQTGDIIFFDGTDYVKGMSGANYEPAHFAEPKSWQMVAYAAAAIFLLAIFSPSVPLWFRIGLAVILPIGILSKNLISNFFSWRSSLAKWWRLNRRKALTLTIVILSLLLGAFAK